MSAPLVEYVRCGDEKGSERDGAEGEMSGPSLSAGVVGDAWGEERGAETRRTASVMVGWKRPPRGECFKRWVGRTWPEKNQAEVILRA